MQTSRCRVLILVFQVREERHSSVWEIFLLSPPFSRDFGNKTAQPQVCMLHGYLKTKWVRQSRPEGRGLGAWVYLY